MSLVSRSFVLLANTIMSRIGKKPIETPSGTTVKIDGNLVLVKGPKGELRKEIAPEIKIEQSGNQLILSPSRRTKKTPALWGLNRMLVYNMIEGATKGFEKKLELEGVGFKVALQGVDLNLSLGFSHPVIFKAVPGVTYKVEKNTITVSGVDKELVGQVAANIRVLKKPEPYKGKGIHYQGEVIKRKAGKRAVGSGF